MLRLEWFTAGIPTLPIVLHSETPYEDPRVQECSIRVDRLKGVGMFPKTDINQPKGYLQEGITWSHTNPELRIVEMNVVISGTFPQMWTAREFMLERFAPRDSAEFDGYLLVTTPTGRKLRLFARYQSGLDFDDLDTDISEMRFPLRVWAKDPFFYTDDLFEVDEIMAAPPSEIYEARLASSFDLFPLGMSLRAVGGTVVNPEIENLTTSESIALTHTLAANETVIYNLDYGTKDVSKAGVSLIGDLASVNDLGSWHLGGGLNNIRVTIGGASTGVSSFFMNWREKYPGV